MPLQQNLRKLGIDAQSRIVDAAQYKSRTENFDFDVVTAALGGSTTPGVELARRLLAPRPRRRAARAISPASPIPSSTR